MTRLAVITAILLATATAQFAAANAPKSSLRPVSREDVFPVALPTFAPVKSLRPVLRPRNIATRTTPRATTAPVATKAAVAAVVISKPDPQPRATAAAQPATGRDAVDQPIAVSNTRAVSGPGRICRDRDLQGTDVGRVPAKLSGCGIRKGAVKLYAVSGVKLSTPAVMECTTAKALKKWVEKGADRAVGRYGGGIVELKVAAGYACRTRNSRKGAKISEHGKGRAIDISAVVLQDGSRISVEDDWGKGKRGRILKKMHKSACGTFGTVLGPNADRYHRDHFHFDVASHRGGAYCR